MLKWYLVKNGKDEDNLEDRFGPRVGIEFIDLAS